MRISDWSSDVCSSDLLKRAHGQSRERLEQNWMLCPNRTAQTEPRDWCWQEQQFLAQLQIREFLSQDRAHQQSESPCHAALLRGLRSRHHICQQRMDIFI